MMTNLQPLIDALLATDPPRTIDAGTEASIRQAIVDDMGIYADVNGIYAVLSPALETVPRNPSL